MLPPTLEICAGSLASALAAQAGGAGRVELCDNLYEGGTTPSHGAISLARERLSIKLHVIIRPRGGDFLYSDDELEIMRRDIDHCRRLKVDGVVLGLLRSDGTVDIKATRELIERARPMTVTFHRAFDMTPDPRQALEDVIETGAERILSSGQKNSAIEGADLIRQLIHLAAGRIIIMPGAGLNENNIRAFAAKVMATEYHATLRSEVESGMVYRKQGIFMGGLKEIPEFSVKETDEERVRRFLREID